MRSCSAIIAALALTCSATSALAGPTCQDQNGHAIRCGAAGAMPVGWSISSSQRWDRDFGRADGSVIDDPIRLICILGSLFALFALLPQFDGREDRDWDRQEDDDVR